MGGVVSNLIVCPKCNHVTSFEGNDKPKRCANPSCNYRFRSFDENLAQEFSWAKDPSEQFFEMSQQIMEKLKDKPLNEIVKDLDPEIAKDLTVSNQMRMDFIKKGLSKDRDKFMMSTRSQDVEGWFKSLHYLMSLSVMSGDQELVNNLVVWGEKIGQMSKALKEYVNAGGKVHEKTDK